MPSPIDELLARIASLERELERELQRAEIVPITLLDLWVTLYQACCCPAYGVARASDRRAS